MPHISSPLCVIPHILAYIPVLIFLVEIAPMHYTKINAFSPRPLPPRPPMQPHNTTKYILGSPHEQC